MKDDILHAPYPKGPGGEAPLHPPQTHMVMGYSKNQKAAKDFLRWAHSRKTFEKWFMSQKAFSIPATREWSKHALWNEDPVMAPFRDVILKARAPGWPGPSGRKAAEVVSKYIITDMYAKAVQGMPPEDAVKWADGVEEDLHLKSGRPWKKGGLEAALTHTPLMPAKAGILLR